VTQHQFLKGLLIPPRESLKILVSKGTLKKKLEVSAAKLGLKLIMPCPPAAATSTAFDMLLTFGIAKIKPSGNLFD
jgi:hypothetical protein